MSNLFPPPSLTYLGSFATPAITECHNALGAICPSQDGGLWISGREGQSQLYAVKISIPTDLRNANSQLVFSNKLDSRVFSDPKYFIPNKPNSYTRLAGLYEHNGWLIWIKRDFYYQQPNNIYPFIGATRLSDGYTVGPFFVGRPYSGEDLESWAWHPMKMAGTISKTPSEVATKYGLNPEFCFTIGHHNSSGTKGTSAGPSCYIFEFNPDAPPSNGYLEKSIALLYYYSVQNGNTARWHGDIDYTIDKNYCLNVLPYHGANRFRAQCWINENFYISLGCVGTGTGWYGAQSYFDTPEKMAEEGFNHPDFIIPQFPITGTKGYHADPYLPMILTYRESDMYNAVYRHMIQPISYTSLKDYFRFDSKYPNGGDYTISGATIIDDKLFICNPDTVISGLKQLPCINVFRVN